MSLFNKNPNETAYQGGQKHWTDVIKNTCPGDQIIWRQPEEDFNTNSTLVVMPGEAAIFVNNGTVEQVFESGTYTLSTQNYPFISRLRNAFTGGISKFNSVVYFVKTAHSAEIYWGTQSPVQVRDKLLGIATTIKSRGSYRIQVTDPVRFLEKMIGNNFASATAEAVELFFDSRFQGKIRSVLATVINESNTEILGIDARTDEIAELIRPHINEAMEEYGLRCVSFAIKAIVIADESGLRKKYDEIGMDAIAKMRNAQADRAVMDTLGDKWEKQQAVNIMQTVAQNPSQNGNGMTDVAMGMGMSMAVGNMFNGMARQMSEPAQQAPQNAQQTVPAENDPIEILSKLKKMLDLGLIEQSEYDAKKAEILSKI